MKLLFKDLGLALDSAGADAVPIPIVGLIRGIYTQAMADGRGDQDCSAITVPAEKLSGVNLKK